MAGGLNTYLYANANPNKYIDPTGELFFVPALPAIGAWLGGTGGAVLGWGSLGLGALGAWAAYNESADDTDCSDSEQTKRKRRFSEKDREDGFEDSKDEDGVPRCEYCGEELTKEPGNPNSYEADHKHPWSRGGESTKENLAPTCRTCNRSKGAKTLDEWEGG